MNEPNYEFELLALLANHQEFTRGLRIALKRATVEKDILLMRRMLYNVNQLTKTIRSILDQKYLENISTEKLHKDIQRTAV
jgi:hypothetical protein